MQLLNSCVPVTTMRKKYFSKLLPLLVTFSLFSCGWPIAHGHIISAVNGILDLRQWDFSRQEEIPLSGEWEIYWKALYDSPSALNEAKAGHTDYFTVPGSWMGHRLSDGTVLGPSGFATFRLRVLLPDNLVRNGQKLSVFIPYQVTSYRLFLWNAAEDRSILLAEGGTVGKNPSEALPLHMPDYGSFRAIPIADFYLQVSNYHEGYKMGPWKEMLIGTDEQISEFLREKRDIDFFLIGLFVIIGFYHLILFMLRTSESSTFWFGVFCFLLALRTLIKGHYLEMGFPDVHLWQMYHRLDYFTYYFPTTVFIIFFRSTFGRSVSRNIYRLLLAASLPFSVAMLILPVYYTSRSLPYFQVITIITIVWMFYEMVRSAAKAKDAIPFIFLSGCFVLSVSVIFDILSVQHIIIMPYIFHFGLTGFIIAQMIIIALINSRARASAEFLSREMRTNNENLLDEIQHRTAAELKIKEQYDIIQRKNEELEAMNEELEAINEEFESVNRELKQTHYDLLRSNENLEREKERLAVTLRSIADGVIATDTTGTITVANETAESLLETSDYGLIGSSIDEIVKILREEDGAEIENPSITAIREGSEVKIDRGYRLVVEGGDGLRISAVASPVKDRNGTIIGSVFVFRDITGIVLAEEERIQAGRIESLGLLAGGIAHDFNNILTAIMGCISLARQQINPKDPVLTLLNAAEKASLQAGTLTGQLLTFSRGGAPIKTVTTIEGLLRDTVTFTLSGSSAKAEFDIQKGLHSTAIDRGQISQVIQNIVLNARDAMPEGGTVRITAENFTVHPETESTLRPGNYIRIRISDSGDGISPDNISRIFDPYFTTKEHGTGLGLTIASSIVRKHDGRLDVRSENGSGTTFEILLPASSDSPLSTSNISQEPSFLKGRVLVMDDDLLILETCRNMLEHAGFDIVTARNGSEAFSYYKAASHEGNPFHCVIMDLTIPGGMGGKEAISHFKQYDPGAVVIASSGYSNDPVMADYAAYGFSAVIAKPYRYEELIKAVYKVINKNTSGNN